MRPLRPDTFELTLPDGSRVVCWRRDADRIRRDIRVRGSVCLLRDPASGVYDRLEPDEVAFVPPGSVRRISR